jgi:hypothetical protein
MYADAGAEVCDWGTAMDEEEWRQKHAECKLSKPSIRIDSLMVATCADDGCIRLWLPTLVG